MYNNKKILALIPARGGSKRLPRKNILNCAGKPLIAWTIEAALHSEFIDSVVVSTDCEEIASVSKSYNARVPFVRPARIANDLSSSDTVVKHAIKYFSVQNEVYDYIILLQPTSPLRTTSDIDLALAFYFSNKKHNDDTLVSVYKVNSKYFWLLRSDSCGYGFFHGEMNISSHQKQFLGSAYLPNGAIFIAPMSGFMSFYSKHSMLYVMSESNSLDIDNILDFNKAECMLSS